MRRFLILSLVLAWPQAVFAHELDAAEVKRLALEAIMEQPEVILQAVQAMREREQDELMQTVMSGENAVVMGDANAPITIVEFFDYNCGFCKRAASVIRPALDENPDVRLILREYPILSEGSLFAARAALAAREQGKYEEFHWALMDVPRVTEESTIEVAEELGIDIEKLRVDMDDDSIQSHIDLSRQIGSALGVTGTPAFLIGDQLIPGFVDEARLAELIEEARQ